ncbi:flagellar hook-associated protein FlgL [Proteiniclasticum sp. BAD-10]|uniref:Flagellar hook-associated protein FlgL n=1 Tax=Proteiniclasticum sediminis TaxID=2804028 RepID=A0A941CNJ1_9CLOT|nr:flagellar hook-associated protein FlgL [Proteiniclasticum sediminis]MBR0575975.1 flagellar hook-associated protein FlgL [Proteiniclasticum sediminis]
MRITNNTLTGNYLRNLSKNLKNMQKYQDQLSSGKEVSRPSDNPMVVSRVMNLDTRLRENEQFKTNIDDALGWSSTADGALASASGTLLRARDLIIYGANGTLSDTDRSALVDEVKMLQGQLSQLFNTNYDGRYIFGGQETTNPPFTMQDGVMTYGGDQEDLQREIAPKVGITLPSNGSTFTNVQGTAVGNESLGSLLQNVEKALESGDLKALSGDLLGDMDKHIDNVIRFRSKMGAVYNRLESARERNDAENLNMTEILSKSEDIDLAEKMMQYSTMSTVYQASLATGAKILQSSLLDYLR